jgi:hypothetical protein
VATLQRELGDPQQVLVIQSGSVPPQIYASMLPDNTVAVTSNGFIHIDGSGNITNSSAMIFANAAKFSVRGAATTMTLLDALFSGLLGIYLLIVGILVLRQHRRGRGLQMVYAVLKIPVAILAAIGWMWTIADVNNGTLSGGWLQFWLWTFMAIGLIYPIALLIVLQLRGVREYYSDVRTTA